MVPSAKLWKRPCLDDPTYTQAGRAVANPMRFVLGFLLVVFCASPPAFAIALGDLRVRSGIGERLWAELPVTGGIKGEVGISFGTEEDYRSLGLERKKVLQDLVPLLSVEGVPRIYLYSLHEVHEASFDIVIKVGSGEETVSRTYHVELAGETSSQPPAVSPPEEAAPPVQESIEQPRAAATEQRHPYVIHTASYRDADLAARQVEELRAGRADAFMALTRIPDKGNLYRVLEGRYITRRKAAEKASELKETTHLSYCAPLKLPYSVAVDAASEAELEGRGYLYWLIPGQKQAAQASPSLLLGAYATSEEAAALAAHLNAQGIPARVIEP